MSEDKENREEEIEYYADGSLSSTDYAIPLWIKLCFVALPVWGVVWFFLHWNGMNGWFDRGSWFELEKAANTTYPYRNVNELKEKQ